jgi:hypothetical protein
MDTVNMLLFAILFLPAFPIILSSFQIGADIFLTPKRNLEWGKIMRKATYNRRHPYNNVREDP